MDYDAAYVTLEHDYCKDPSGVGSGLILLADSNGAAFSGGSGDYSYEWNGPTGTYFTRDLYNLIAGDYTVSIIDNQFGCTASKTFTIISNPPLSITFAPSTPIDSSNRVQLVCDSSSQSVEILATGGFGDYAFVWEKDGVILPNTTFSLGICLQATIVLPFPIFRLRVFPLQRVVWLFLTLK